VKLTSLTPFGTYVFRMGVAVVVPWYVVMAWTGTRELDTKVSGPGAGAGDGELLAS